MTRSHLPSEPRPNFSVGDFLWVGLTFGIIGGLVFAIWLHDWFHQPYLASAGAVFVIIMLFCAWWNIRSLEADRTAWRARNKFRQPKSSTGTKHTLMVIGLIVLAIPLYFLLTFLFSLI